MSNQFARKGYYAGVNEAFRVDTIAAHASSVQHSKAVVMVATLPALQLALKKSLEKQRSRLEVAASSDDKAMLREWTTHAMRLSYFCAKKNLPYSLVSELSFLVKDTINCFSDDPVFEFPNHQYGSSDSRGATVEMISSCAATIMEATAMSLATAGFYSLMIDESNDISTSKNLVVMARYVSAGIVKSCLLGLVALADGTADTVDTAVKNLVEKRNLANAVLVGFATDGASVMRGRVKGVATQFKRRNPILVTAHCPGHRLELAVEDALEAFDQVRVAAVRATYAYFNKSHTRRRCLADAAAGLGIRSLRPLQQAFTRWLSLGDALSNLHIVYPAIRIVLEDDLESIAANGLYNNFYGTVGFEYWVAAMNDIVCEINTLSVALQSESINIVSVLPVLQAKKDQLSATFVIPQFNVPPTTPSLRRLAAAEGTTVVPEDGEELAADVQRRETAWCDKEVEHGGCVAFVKRLLQALEVRFPEETESVVHHLGCLYPENMIMAPLLPAFGLVSLDYLIKLYGKFVEGVDAVHVQYGGYKSYIVKNYPTANADNLLQLVIGINHVTANYPSIVVLLTIALTMAHGSVDCERAFSLQNTIKSKSRNGLSVEHLEELMICARDGPDLNEFDAPSQTRTWFAAKKRKLCHSEVIVLE
jgi:hypothetical protein